MGSFHTLLLQNSCFAGEDSHRLTAFLLKNWQLPTDSSSNGPGYNSLTSDRQALMSQLKDNDAFTGHDAKDVIESNPSRPKRYPFKDRRSGKDRRAGQTSPLSPRSLFGRRKSSRRKEDARRFYFVDLYSPVFMVLLLLTMALSMADAFLTMKLVSESFQEANPVMDYFLRMGPTAFILSKWLLTAFGMIVLLVLKNYYVWGKVKAAVLMVLFPFLYLLLITYEVMMVMKL